jgi:hypothetical protein
MDGPSFDTFVRLARAAASRRSALKAALVPAIAGLGAATLARPSAVVAKKKKKKCKKCKAKGLGESCTSNKECCTNETNRLCAIASNELGDDLTCCGGVGASCSSTNDCCGDFTCDSGTCQS